MTGHMNKKNVTLKKCQNTFHVAACFFSVSNCVKFDISRNEDVKMQIYSRRIGKYNIF